MNTETIYNVIGVLGASLILLGFYRTSIGRWKNRSFVYELDNLVGALLLIGYQFHHMAYISATLNVIWAIIAFTGLTSFAQRYKWGKPSKKARRKT